jgi:hypothetical protein
MRPVENNSKTVILSGKEILHASRVKALIFTTAEKDNSPGPYAHDILSKYCLWAQNGGWIIKSLLNLIKLGG